MSFLAPDHPLYDMFYGDAIDAYGELAQDAHPDDDFAPHTGEDAATLRGSVIA